MDSDYAAPSEAYAQAHDGNDCAPTCAATYAHSDFEDVPLSPIAHSNSYALESSSPRDLEAGEVLAENDHAGASSANTIDVSDDTELVEANGQIPAEVLSSLESLGAGLHHVNVTCADDSEKNSEMTKISEDTKRSSGSKFEVESFDSMQLLLPEDVKQLTAKYTMPAPKKSERYNKLRYGFFSAYRRLFSVFFLANIILMCSFGALSTIRPGFFTYQHAGTAVAVNVFVTSLARHEHFINLLFKIVISIPHSAPLSFRRHASKIYSFGGVHSGCGVSAFLWYICYATLLLTAFPKNVGLIAKVSIMTACFIVLIVLSYPPIRSLHHNSWEWSHRFAGWVAVAVFWAQILLVSFSAGHTESINPGMVLITTPAFYFLCAIMYLLIYPWLRLRRRTYDVEKISNHSVRLWVHHDTHMATCRGTRLATNPLLENHGFATIPNENGARGYSVLIAKNGDWTTKIVEDPPRYLWQRGAPTTGVASVSLVFKKVLCVCTGTGIGPILSFIQAHPEWNCRILWTARMPQVSFGSAIMGAVTKSDPNALIYDTANGRCDMSALTYAAAKESEAEAVIIISNPKLTKQVVYDMECRGVAAFGAIWDS
ncbi:unnamed protein product [Zymoseptoria tritici ST99CH_1A5]|uniref:AMP-dependent synthetase/ligase domain-containing protein n=1 Tax=Zymoseptoria tritici ST99CH_1A5 TaxID=1276529 RepID=A0A1Y6LUV9_ZYMTR|nr:unnamed protein product [Zymoseptoria tritici ST99CH_1A5]